MRAGVRHAINRLLAIALFSTLLAVGIAAAVEAVAALAEQGSQLDPPIEYREWWSDLSGVDLSETELALVAGGVIALGVALLLFELWPSRRDPRAVIAEAESGRAELRVSSLQPYLEDRLRTLDWVRDPKLRVKVRGGTARVKAVPLASRLTAEADLGRARALVGSSIEEIGLEPGPITLSPQIDKKTLRVR
jgi:hypothetical protein